MELGYTGEHNGFLIDSFELNGQTQHIYGQNVSMVFIDPGFGPTGTNHLLQGDVGGGVTANVPITFATMALMNRTQTNGIEFLYTYRQHLTHNGGQVQWMVGARYLRFDDEFFVDATGGNLADSAWDTMAKNRIWGPEIGVRWLKQFGRVSLSSEGRFMAGVNNQSIQQYGEIASLLTGTSNNPSPLPTLLHATTFDHSAELTEFSPLGEFRIEGHVQLTKLISFKAGWTGIVMGGMARSADMVLYNMNGDTGVPLGIVTDNNRAVVFMQGINIGVESEPLARSIHRPRGGRRRIIRLPAATSPVARSWFAGGGVRSTRLPSDAARGFPPATRPAMPPPWRRFLRRLPHHERGFSRSARSGVR